MILNVNGREQTTQQVFIRPGTPTRVEAVAGKKNEAGEGPGASGERGQAGQGTGGTGPGRGGTGTGRGGTGTGRGGTGRRGG